MHDIATVAESGKPPIYLTQTDYDTIAGMALGIEDRAPALATLLLNEIDRAEICSVETIPGDAVRLGSEVEFLDEANDNRRSVRLVLPCEADIAAGRISIMTPVGAGLIGMRAGDRIDWPCPDGRPRVLRMLKVCQGG